MRLKPLGHLSTTRWNLKILAESPLACLLVKFAGVANGTAGGSRRLPPFKSHMIFHEPNDNTERFCRLKALKYTSNVVPYSGVV